ncbi:phage recombination protein Bet [Geomonas nitrogeniifigens]|uniref:phage recombination protein Bet n=1 Tax=Geomonas diazotrophica TaxID=2843197 RepID=UPI001C2BD754|nr:phage recombination protein Bet [Geomonas nitrogeniifigens]QXE87378.1 phage recombination protein Bet [Geomonas nitrogeniifigens]
MSSNAVTKIDFDKEQLAVIEAQFFPTGASKAEQQYCFAVARELGLNPILKEVQFVPRRQKVGDRWVNKVEPMVGRDGFLSIAHKSNQLAGIETLASIKEIPQLESGKWVIKPQLVAECTVWRKDSSKPFTVQVSYNEYVQKTVDGGPTKFWSEKPETMLKKVAESQALRKAFNIHGVYCPEEVGGGYESEGGEIVTPAMEEEYPSPASRLVVVPALTECEVITPAQGPAVLKEEPGGTSPPEQTKPTIAHLESSVVAGILSMLEGRNIPHEVDMRAGVISANSYNERQLLKAAGFKWIGEAKAWILKFEPDPF